ncbi:unnamed protein product [Polarella glacialis]|uniref:FHA domain-containing protein n=1 Tax=Polarella glacialis TaxID=89957 RepID=A0A813IHY3_POLGL|nr:unnamed protein product [Polarella glacialis]
MHASLPGWALQPAVQLEQICDEPPPCELPAWCSAPDSGLLDADVEVWRVPQTAPPGSPGAPGGPTPGALLLGRRAWVHFGRRHQSGAKGGRQPDVELLTATASRKQALVLRNWHGQTFLMDLGSSHGTFLGRHRLQPNVPKEWRPGATVFFADRATETFELRPKGLKPSSFVRSTPALGGFAVQAPAVWPSGAGISAIAAAVAAATAATAATASTTTAAATSSKPASSKVSTSASSSSLPQQPGPTTTAPTPTPTTPTLTTTSSSASFAGARRMGAVKLGEELKLRPKEQPPEAVPRKPFPQVPSRARPAGLGSLAARLERSFGDNPLEIFRELGPYYPCPRLGNDFQLSLWSKCSARVDRERPAVVVTAASFQAAEPQITVQWLCANIPCADLQLRLTDAPPDVAEPGPEGLLQVDLPLDASQQRLGAASLRLPREALEKLPSEVFLRIYSRKGTSCGDGHHAIRLLAF